MALKVEGLRASENELCGYIHMDSPKCNTLYSISIRVINELKIGKRIERRTCSRAVLVQFIKVNKGCKMPHEVENLSLLLNVLTLNCIIESKKVQLC